MSQHNEHYQRIFTHPETIQQVLQSFVQQDGLNEVDFLTLGTCIN